MRYQIETPDPDTEGMISTFTTYTYQDGESVFFATIAPSRQGTGYDVARYWDNPALNTWEPGQQPAPDIVLIMRGVPAYDMTRTLQILGSLEYQPF